MLKLLALYINPFAWLFLRTRNIYLVSEFNGCRKLEIAVDHLTDECWARKALGNNITKLIQCKLQMRPKMMSRPRLTEQRTNVIVNQGQLYVRASVLCPLLTPSSLCPCKDLIISFYGQKHGKHGPTTYKWIVIMDRTGAHRAGCSQPLVVNRSWVDPVRSGAHRWCLCADKRWCAPVDRSTCKYTLSMLVVKKNNAFYLLVDCS